MGIDRRADWVVGLAPPPTDADRPVAPATWPAWGQPWEGILLGERLVAAPTHWADGRSHLCTGPGVCLHCLANSRTRLQYYIAAWEGRRGTDVVLSVGAMCADEILQIAEEKHQLRGLDLIITKLGSAARSRFDVQLRRCINPLSGLRQPCDVLASMERLFGVRDIARFILVGEEGA